MLAWQYVGANGDLIAIDNMKVTQGTTGIGDNKAAIDQLLSQNYPDPFSTQTRIPFRLENKSDVRLMIYNSLGQQVAEPVSGTMNAGNHEVFCITPRNLLLSAGCGWYCCHKADDYCEIGIVY